MPEVFNTDQGTQFTSQAFTGRLAQAGIAISMDGRGRALDNVFAERLWRSVKYEEFYFYEHATVASLAAGLEAYFGYYCHQRPHQALGNRTPAAVYALAANHEWPPESIIATPKSQQHVGSLAQQNGDSTRTRSGDLLWRPRETRERSRGTPLPPLNKPLRGPVFGVLFT